jgi:hypothetical protein
LVIFVAEGFLIFDNYIQSDILRPA